MGIAGRQNKTFYEQKLSKPKYGSLEKTRQTAEHVISQSQTRCHFETIKISNIFKACDLLFAMVFSKPPCWMPRRPRGWGWFSISRWNCNSVCVTEMAWSLGVNPGTPWWEARALITNPSLLPKHFITCGCQNGQLMFTSITVSRDTECFFHLLDSYYSFSVYCL